LGIQVLQQPIPSQSKVMKKFGLR